MSDWPPKIAVTIGKFKPLHQGHELMVSMAAAEMDEVIVIVSDTVASDQLTSKLTESYMPLNYRYKAVCRAFGKYPNVKVVKHVDLYGEPKQYDNHGTAVDDEFWDYWTNVFKILAPDAIYFVSSDRYGQEAANRLHIGWFPVDPDRELINISATRIRANPIDNWHYINEEFRSDFGKRILVIGPESTGKTTLTKDLGIALGSPVVPEYGRFLSEAKNNDLNIQDFHRIVVRHASMEETAMRVSKTGLTISDTDRFTTYLFSKIYLGVHMANPRPRSGRSVNPDRYDLVVLLPPVIPWIDDGTRVISDYSERVEFYDQLLEAYREHPNLVILTETDRQKRVDIVCGHVASMLQDDKIFTNVYERLTKQDISLNVTV